MGSDKLHGLHHLLELGMLGLSRGRVMPKKKKKLLFRVSRVAASTTQK